MEAQGIYKVLFAVTSLSQVNYLKELGVSFHQEKESITFSFPNGSKLEVVESDLAGLKEIHWASDFDKVFTDQNITHVFNKGYSLTTSECSEETATNSYSRKNRINRSISVSESSPCGISHIAIYSADYLATAKQFLDLGYIVSDSIKGRCIFLRSKSKNSHHQLLISNNKDRQGLHHISLAMKDIYSVFTKGVELSSLGWKTVMGPGRHIISSSTHWYFETGLGSFEITADEDYLDENWKATEFDPTQSLIYEWAIEGGLDHRTRRQHGVANTQFIDQKIK